MAENEGMEGKNLAQDQLKQFNEQVLKEIKKLKNGESKIIIGEMEAINLGGQAILKIRGISIAIARGKEIEYNLANYQEVKKVLEEEGQTLENLGLPDLEEAIDLEEQAKKEQEDKQEEQEEQPQQPDEEIDEEKDDEKPELEEEIDPKKEEIAKQYNLNARDVVHFANDERITENERFQGLVEWSKDYDDVYVIPGENYYSYKFIGSKEDGTEEIEAGTNKVIGGKNPDVTIKRIDGEQITVVVPLAMYEVDDETAIAMVKNEYGEVEAIYCRQQEGNEKEYWGSVIPEESGKNVLQQEPKTREFMDYRYNSEVDLADKAEALERQEDLEQRGLPSEQEGVQIEEIEGNHEQNIAVNLEDIAEDLMKRDGIIDRATVPPGMYEHKAEKVLALMEGNKNITYEQAIEQIENEGQREQGGRVQGELAEDPRRG